MIDEKEKKQRTLRQNRALHKYFTMLADELNAAGLDMKKVLKPDVDIPWTAENVKDNLWRGVQIAMFNKASTTELTTDEMTKVYETINRFTAEKHGVSVSFPSEEEQMLKSINPEDYGVY